MFIMGSDGENNEVTVFLSSVHIVEKSQLGVRMVEYWPVALKALGSPRIFEIDLHLQKLSSMSIHVT